MPTRPPRPRTPRPVATVTPALRPAGEQALDAAAWERLRHVIEGLAALPVSAAEVPADRAGDGPDPRPRASGGRVADEAPPHRSPRRR